MPPPGLNVPAGGDPEADVFAKIQQLMAMQVMIQDKQDDMHEQIEIIQTKVDTLVQFTMDRPNSKMNNDLETKVQQQLEMTETVMQKISAIETWMNDVVPRGPVRRSPISPSTGSGAPRAKPAGAP